GLRVLVGHCVDLGDVGLPYLPFVDLLRPLAADPTAAPAALTRPALAALLAGRAEALPAADEGRPGGDPVDRVLRPAGDDGRLQLFESVAALLAEVAATAPLAAALAGESLPGGLADVLLARVEQLAPGVQQVLRAAAVAGRRVRHELLAAVAGLDPPGLESALAEAVHAHVLVVTGDGRYRF